MTITRFVGLVLKGAAMGAANVIPGVSGGTIALITGIYADLIDTLKSFGWKAVSYGALPFLIAAGLAVLLFALARRAAEARALKA